ncbi:hypothetical protein UCRPA7_6192 [Phaeoacremonium minimum UCRPA7]|uniref:DUF924-domain-containing protein n=1 Tax=Phaeoacremonium minimum (strain UCR-PA7) TaxID=1286976 RepID=R8BG21_PHAM7|nr:hypothetical protein UCRPA7_6192 [Phaeoacremonium minimum UCRPA7]EON98266.1 hypothetical protein UCRPA7_6192 [Phaeoacremonium minimum UCRPA7]
MASSIREIITPTLLQDVRTTWFEQCDSDELVILPSQDTMMQWFRRNEEFDRICVSRFSPALEELKASGVDGDALLDAVQPSSPLDWLSLVLLFDQIPRNAYRGPESAIVFNVFDPIARAIATRAIDAGIPLHAQIRYRIGYRMWFCLPLMHSEDIALHKLAVEQIEAMADDVRGAGAEPGFSNADGDELACRKVLADDKEAAAKRCEGQLEFEKKHQVIIERFGRYPHRNEALGRTPTPEEKEYLENGGDTFG